VFANLNWVTSTTPNNQPQHRPPGIKAVRGPCDFVIKQAVGNHIAQIRANGLAEQRLQLESAVLAEQVLCCTQARERSQTLLTLNTVGFYPATADGFVKRRF